MAGQVEIDTEAIKVLANLLNETDLTEIEYQVDSLRIKVMRASPTTVIQAPVSAQQSLAANQNNNSAPVSQAQEEKTTESLEDHPGVIEAQMVGTVYLSPGPGTDPFISVGDTVSQGQTLFIIEAMKVMNMIKAPRSGVVKHIFVKDSRPVEYGDPVVIIE
ncbi:MAG: acetyl-CoA carboxylase biotin carboxyl carrier protein [Holosporaceae bacterium]|nr:acetyl-CoA carboxylase biotin carboxyl carrier protein [Holosporaceae bacterium]